MRRKKIEDLVKVFPSVLCRIASTTKIIDKTLQGIDSPGYNQVSLQSYVSTWTGDCDLEDVWDWFSAGGEEDGGGEGEEMTYGENLC